MVKQMKKMEGIRTDLAIEKRKNNQKLLYKSNDNSINIYEIYDSNSITHCIGFEDFIDEIILKDILKKELHFFIDTCVKLKHYHAFVIGLGNENNTADSIGPKVVNLIQVNSHLESLGVKLKGNKISALEPGVLGKTGIDTKKIIESVTKEIKPDFLLLIDSYVSKDIDYLNKTIQITNEGIIPGSGLKIANQEISSKTLGLPVIVIGIPTAIEVNFYSSKKGKKFPYLVSTKDIDAFILKITKIISDGLNEVFYEC